MSVVRLVPNEMAASIRFDPDDTLEAMKGKPITRLVVLSECEDGSLELETNCNSGEALFLIERARHLVVFGE